MASKARKVSVEQRPFTKRMLTLTPKHRLWDVWADFITMFACALSNRFDRAHYEEREAMYMRIIKKYDKDEQQVFPMLAADLVEALDENPNQDFLGSAYMELELGNDHAGQVFTPYDVCCAMASISGGRIPLEVMDKGFVSINDCACGAGATLIAACHEAGKQLAIFGLNWQNHILVTAQDIDFLVGMMCYIQLSLIGAAGYVKIGNSLTDPMTKDDGAKNYWYTPMYFSDVWHWRRVWHSVDRLMQQPADKRDEGEKLHDAVPGKENAND